MKTLEISKALPLVLIFLLYGIRSSVSSSTAKNDGAAWRNTDDFTTTPGIETIGVICALTKNYSFCVTVLTQDPRSNNTDNLIIFGLIAADATSQSLLSTYNKVKTLIDRNRDPKLKDSLDICLQLYQTSIVEIKKAPSYLTKPSNFKDLGTGISGRANECEKGFTSSESPLTLENNVVVDFGSIIEVIGTLLLNKR